MTAHISLSFELISLITWIIKNERNLLNNLVKQAVEHGFAEELNNIHTVPDPKAVNDHMAHNVLDFLEFLEDSMIKNLETVHVDNKTKDAILPTLQRLEAGNLDVKTVLLSLQQTKARLTKAHNKHQAQQLAQPAPQENSPATILFEQLLKNWKPNNKEIVN